MTQSQQQALNIVGAVDAIRNAENVLMAQINATADMLAAIKLNQAYQHLDSVLGQILHLQNTTDDQIFASAAASIKGQTTALQSDEHTIQGLINDVGTAKKVIGYVGQALGFISKLC
ncbi:hypothetical protein [Dyella acidiphila]|uniref:Methyl-accepting chemotaxis protein n=1 Tax=Dyella acidiphila TaxID=2775866 RepID=A0ABR9GGA2_9GAMM|nr:hypothetical protein [Dyella acidiphila]MBE1163040.1 hypothetical protein [Dyella acidiphila]